MATAAHHHRAVRIVAVASGGFTLVLALAAASAASPGGAVAAAGAGAGAREVASAGTWGTAIEVPGTAALNLGDAAFNSVSCPAAGTCSAGGSYTGAVFSSQAFVAGEVNGVWGKAREVPGTAALNKGAFAEIRTVSCPAAGTCGAGGLYTDAAGHIQALVVGEVRGVWGKAREVPGTAALNKGDAEVNSVSCPAAGTCGAGGTYTDVPPNSGQAFVVGEVRGVWGKAREVPGTAALNTGADAAITSLSCPAPGTCSAGGFYTDASSHIQAFVVAEVHGVWGKAHEVPGTAALNTGGDATIHAVSCPAAGTCSAAGSYTDASNHIQVFAAGEVRGVWGKAREIPGTAALNTGGDAETFSVSCPAAGTCSAGGFYTDASDHVQVFVADEVNGVWGKAHEVPGTAALNQGGNARLFSVSCPAAGTCSAGGSYAEASGRIQAFVVDEVNGVWGKAQEVPGTAALNRGGNAQITSVSCARAGICGAGGTYTDASGNTQAFVVNRT